jgi:carbamoylphosphate synthase large subunit
MMQLACVEDIDPIGIHAGDSIAVLPAQTLLDREIQDMRDTAFAITRKLRIVGVNHVQFALDQANGKFYVIKNNPYFDRLTAFAGNRQPAMLCRSSVANYMPARRCVTSILITATISTRP